MSERHIQLCREAMTKTSVFPERECWEAHPPELLLAMHEFIAAFDYWNVFISTMHMNPEEAKRRQEKMTAVRARYEEMTND